MSKLSIHCTKFVKIYSTYKNLTFFFIIFTSKHYIKLALIYFYSKLNKKKEKQQKKLLNNSSTSDELQYAAHFYAFVHNDRIEFIRLHGQRSESKALLYANMKYTSSGKGNKKGGPAVWACDDRRPVSSIELRGSSDSGAPLGMLYPHNTRNIAQTPC